MENCSGDDSKFQMDVLCKNLQSADRGLRQAALKLVLERSESEKVTAAQISELFDVTYLHLFKCYTDKFETCRSLAASVLTAMLDRLPANDFYAECMVPVIARRIGQKEIVEDSEEVRLQLVQQLLQIVEKFRSTETDHDRLLKVYNDIIDVLVKTLRDPYPSIQRESCTLVNKLAEATPSFHGRAESLAAPLIIMLEHRQSPSRIAAVSALGTVALHIHSNGEAVVKIIVSVSPLLMDGMPYVRRECGRVGCLWLMLLRDRYSFFERLLPLVFCCLKDETAEIRSEIDVKWKLCGEQYYRENENELAKTEPVDRPPAKYPTLVDRPTLGCRALMQRSLRLISIVLREMEDWKEDVRLHSLKLLWQVVLHSEKALTAKFIEIFPVLAKCCADPDLQVAAEALKVSELLGMLLEYKTWITHALKTLRSSPNIGVLKCFFALFSGASNEKYEHLLDVSVLISLPTICHSMKPDYQSALLDLTDILVDIHLKTTTLEETMETLSLDCTRSTEACLYEILVKVISLAESHETIPERGKQILIKLAGAPWELRALHAKYLRRILEELDDLDSENSDMSEPIILLHGLIWLCGFQEVYLPSMRQALRTVLANASASGQIKVLSAVSISMLNWTDSMSMDDPQKSQAQLNDFVEDIIEPCLIWKVGRSAESLRAMATACLCSMSQGAPLESFNILPNLTRHLISLVEDNSVVTRAYALRCLQACGPVLVEQLKPLGLAVLARLDDPSAEVREFAAQCIWRLKLQVVGQYDQESWDTVMKHICDTLLLHLDDPEIKLRQTVLDTLSLIRKDHPKIFDKSVEDLPKAFPYMNELRAIQSKT